MKWYPAEVDWDEIEPPVYQCSFCENKVSKPRTNTILTCPDCLKNGKPETRLQI